MTRKRFPVKTSLIKDLPQEKQDWLNNLKPPKREGPTYPLKPSKKRKGV